MSGGGGAVCRRLVAPPPTWGEALLLRSAHMYIKICCFLIGNKVGLRALFSKHALRICLVCCAAALDRDALDRMDKALG